MRSENKIATVKTKEYAVVLFSFFVKK